MINVSNRQESKSGLMSTENSRFIRLFHELQVSIYLHYAQPRTLLDNTSAMFYEKKNATYAFSVKF